MKTFVYRINLLCTLILLSNIFFVCQVSAQTTASAYTFVNSTAGSLASDRYGHAIDMSTGTTQLIGANQDNTASGVTNIGFTFSFMGNNFTQFSASSNGAIRLGGTAISSAITTLPQNNQDLIAPYFGDLETSASGKVHYKLVGSSPTRTLVIEFLNMGINKNSSTANGTFQVRLFETSNIIEFVYGTMSVGAGGNTGTTNAYIGFSNDNGSNDVLSVNQSTFATSTSSTAIVNANTVAGSITGLTSAADGSRRSFSFGRAYASRFISANLGAATWCAGETRNITVTVQNVGVRTWTDATPDINIGVKWNTNGANWTDYYIRTDASNLASGAEATYTLPITASNNTGSGYTTPLAVGTNRLTFDAVVEAVSWFGDNNSGVGPGNTEFASSNQTIVGAPTAGAGAALATICQGGTSASLGGSVGGSATGGTWSDGGVGGTFTPNATSLNATWKPPVSFSGTATLTLTTTGGSCGTATASKNITVNATPTANAGAALSAVCQGGTTTGLGGSVGGSATGGTWSSSSGGSFSPNANTLNATWTPPPGFTGTATLTLTSSGGNPCSAATSSKTQVVTPTASVNAAADLPAICQGGTTTGLGGSVGGSATGGIWSDGGIGGTFNPSAANLNATWTSPANYNGTVTLTLTATGGCGSPADTKSQVVNAAPAGVAATPASSTICFGSAVSLTGSGTLSGSSATIIDNFNGATAFAATGTSSGDRSQVWQQEISGSNVNSVATFTSTGGGSLMVSTAGASGINFNASSVSSTLTSGIIDASNFSSLSSLTFTHTYKQGSVSGSGVVQVSTDGGSNWTTLATYSSTQGGSTSFVPVSLSWAPVNKTNLRIRFVFNTANQNVIIGVTSWWAIDDVALNGVKVPLYSWTASTASGVNGLPVGAGAPSVSNANISVNPKVTTSYTLTAANPTTNCTASGTPVVVNVNPVPTLIAQADATLNTSADGTGNCSTVYNWTHPSVNTACTTTLTVAYTAGAQAPATLPAGGVVTAGGEASVAFYTGTTIVTYTATDQNNNIATTSFKVTVADDELPGITCSPDVTVSNTTDQCNATVILTAPVTSDNCGVASVTNDHPSNIYPTGTTSVTWTVTDNSNNVQTCIQKVTVNDTQLPTITCNADVSVNSDLHSCGAAVNLTVPTTNDNCGVTSVTNDHSSSNLFPVGTTIVKWTVTDNSGNIATCDQTVTVTDNEQPVITCPASVNTETDPAASYGTVTLAQPTVTDNCDVAGVINDHPSSQFPIGTTLVTWTVTDIHGNSNTCVQTIIVNDNIQPSIANNPQIDINNTSGDCSGSTDVTYPAASDNSGHVTVTSDYPGLPIPSVDPVIPFVANSVNFPVGSTTIIWTATDPSANTSWSAQLVVVTDNEKPSIECSGDINQVNDPGSCSAIITLETPATSDNCGVASVANDHPSNIFPVGETIVTWTVIDIHGNKNTCVQKITVTDTELPTIICAGDVSMNTDNGKCYAIITLTPPESGDNCGVASVTNDHLSAIFNEGEMIVTWTVTDVHGNIKTCVQKVTVTDKELPVISASADINQTADAGRCGATILITNAIATDNCGVGATTGTRSDGLALSDPYPVGTTTITWTVTDIHGNVAAPVLQTVTVTDDERPVITATADISVNNDAGNCGAVVNIVNATATDNCGVAAPAGTRNDGLALNAVYPVGSTTITWTTTDIHGNSALDVVQTITVTDNELPVITASADINQTADPGLCGALISVSVATATDNCGVGATHGVRSDGLSLSTPYPVGTTTITWTVTDIHGNAAIPVSQTVTVTDDELPVITASTDINVSNDPGNCGALVDIVNATATDNCGVNTPIGTRSDGLSLSALYPVGTTIVTWTATDIHGNKALEVTQSIEVTDNESPVVTASSDFNVTNDLGKCGAAVTIVPATATDNCGVGATTGTRSDGLSLTDLYPVGTTTITWTVTDIHGNPANAVNQYVNVTDTEIPVITASPDVHVNNNTGVCSAVVAVVPPTVVDNCGVTDPIPGTRSDGLALTEPYAVGNTIITWNVKDIHGNAAMPVIQNITVTDNELPVIAANDDISQAADAGECGALVTIAPAIATDNCGVGATTGTRNDGSALNALYPVGTTTITWTVSDIHGNAALPVVQTVTITDIQKPVIATNGDKSVNNDANACGAAVTVSATATDNCTVGAPTGVRSDGLALDAAYPVGTTTIAWNVTDINGVAALPVVQTVTVTDNTKPTFTRPVDITIYTTATCTYDASVTATGDVTNETDNCSTTLQATFSDVVTNGACQGSKVITRTWHLVDNHDNAAADQVQTITVLDNIKPVVACTSNKSVNANNGTPGCSYKQTGTNWDATATDNCSTTTIKYTLSGATTSATNAYATLNNVVFNSGTTIVSAQAYDACGNLSDPCSFTVTVGTTLDVSVGNSNPQLYYGYSLDQATVIRATPTGGTAPYKVVITMNRIMSCNVVNNTGDELWTAKGNGSIANTGISCPTSGPASIPVSTFNAVASGGKDSVTATLLANAVFTITVTDANGCIVTKTTNVYSEDARCFAGNSGNAKVKICHQTGNSDKCHELCVAESAVQAHLDHGDFLGSCTSNCLPPPVIAASPAMTPTLPVELQPTALDVKVMNNPSVSNVPFRLKVVSDNEKDAIQMRIMDGTGRPIEFKPGITNGQTVEIGRAYVQGMYFVEVLQGKQRKVVKLVKQ